jgi:hypothetical protein
MRKEITTSDFWFRSLMGERVGCDEETPEPGFYRVRWDGAQTDFVPARIWIIREECDDPDHGEPGEIMADDQLCAEKAGEPVDWREIWPTAGRHPITAEVFQEMSDADQ